ncbi:MAG TPA: hypothetical protein VF463_19595 [Sphingobium sp.]
MVDQIIHPITLLPQENIAKLIGMALREGDKPKKDDTGKPQTLRLCDGEQGT